MTKEAACELEQQLIYGYQSTDPAKGYNLSSGGQSGAAGRIASEETRAKLSVVHKGKRMSEAAKRKLSEARAGKPPGAEHRQKLSESHARQTVVCIDTGTVYASVSDAARIYEECKGNIIRACKGIRKTAGGVRWRYLEVE